MVQSEPAVKVEQLSFKMKRKQLLHRLDYVLPKGKILAVCGGNGAGKSTLIRLLIGLARSTTGNVWMNDYSLKKQRKKYIEQFGYMPDDFSFNKQLTAKETIQFSAKLKNVKESAWLEKIAAVGLTDKLNEKIGNFSKGMNQRLLLAQALLADPPIIILDEPTNGLDPYWITQFCELMLEAKAKGQTVIFSTHELYAAEQIADEVMFLRGGEVISQGPISDYERAGLHETFQQLYFKNHRQRGGNLVEVKNN